MRTQLLKLAALFTLSLAVTGCALPQSPARTPENLMETVRLVETAFLQNSHGVSQNAALRAERTAQGVHISAQWETGAESVYFAAYNADGQMLGAAVAPDGSVSAETEIVCAPEEAETVKLFPVDANGKPVSAAVVSSVEDGASEITLTVAGQPLTVEWADNSSVDALRELLRKGDLTLEMSDYAGFEKGAPLPETLPQNNQQMNTDAGDVILYQGRQFVIYYDTNRYSLTPLGKITGISKAELQALLGAGNVTATLAIK
ncbi:MAG: hypothetical protein IJR54_05040 [Oscillibacter sp.]|nr:hypothetical protein [Oscillibacter sp.]